MLRRRFVALFLMLLAAIGISAIVYAQLETAERGILPLDSSGTLEIGGIHVDVGGADAESARYAGWRVAQRLGFRALWAKIHHAPASQAPNLPDSTLNDIVSAINVEREEIGPRRYIADLGVQFDRARAAPFLGVEGGQVQRSAPMLLIPITVSAGTATSVELRNAWQRAWAQFRTSQSPIDYVRVSGMGTDPLLVNAALTGRPGRGWWRNLLDLYGATDILVAEVQLQRSYPGGPARARFIARHGPDNEIIGGFTLTAPNSDAIPGMMAQGVQRMDALYAQALDAGRLNRDESLNLPPPPVQIAPAPEPIATPLFNAYQVQITGKDVNIYNFAMAHLRTLPGVDSATPQQINPSGTSYVLVHYRGDISQLAAALSARGWIVDTSGTVVRMRSSSDKPPALPPPPVSPPPAQQPQPPQQQQPQSQPKAQQPQPSRPPGEA
ncbi:MAG TPA: heavy-metal-associated domain-containing protein [Sphingomicrobium sp.]|nr:heavy-metal-associated domain-containing protein [Sphingomicrobium sp.]